MNKRMTALASLALAGTLLAALPAGQAHADEPMVKCELHYNLQGWSIIYKHAEGAGTVTCNNGQSAAVKITVVGGGLTAGKYRVENGKGEISKVHGIDEVFGTESPAPQVPVFPETTCRPAPRPAWSRARRRRC